MPGLLVGLNCPVRTVVLLSLMKEICSGGAMKSEWWKNNIVTVCNRPLTNQVIRAILCTWLRDQHLDNLIHHVTDKSVPVHGQ